MAAAEAQTEHGEVVRDSGWLDGGDHLAVHGAWHRERGRNTDG